MAAKTGVIAQRKGLEAIILADPTLAGLLAGDAFYARRAEAGSPLPYIVQDPQTESNLNAGHFMQPGNQGTETLKIWAATLFEGQDIYAALRALLHRKQIPMEGHAMLRGTLGYITDLLDEQGNATVIIARYEWRALEV